MNLLYPKSETVETSQRKYWEKFERDEIAIAKKLGLVNGHPVCQFPFHKDWITVGLGETGLVHPLANLYDPDHTHGKSHEFLHHDFIWIVCRICHGWCTSGFKHPIGDIYNFEVRYLGLLKLSEEKDFRFRRALRKSESLVTIERIEFFKSKD